MASDLKMDTLQVMFGQNLSTVNISIQLMFNNVAKEAKEVSSRN